jgi:hypothetical protein
VAYNTAAKNTKAKIAIVTIRTSMMQTISIPLVVMRGDGGGVLSPSQRARSTTRRGAT